jgi:hypothetical protein
MNQSTRPMARLYRFLQEIYGEQPTMTRVEVDVEKQSGGVRGTPHQEATNVRVYAGDTQILPDFARVPYWKEVLAAYPYLFQGCQTHQDYLDTVQELLEREQLYLDYGLDWPDVNEKVFSPLSFSMEELHKMASKGMNKTETANTTEENNE